MRIYLANDDHTDYMWTADAETYNATFVDMLDYYLRLADETTGNPAPYQSRFNADGSYWLWQYERRKSPAEFAHLIARIKEGALSAPLTTLVSCYGGQPMEAVLRGMYYAGRLERRYHLRFPLATAMENQTLPLGLASLWAGSGARYTWRGVCGCASKMSNQVLGQRPHEIYWYTGQDGQRVLMKWYSLGPHGIGTYLEASAPDKAIEYLDSNTNFLRRYVDAATGNPFEVRGAFGFGGDCLARKTGVPADPGIPKRPGMQQGVVGFPYTEHFHVIAQAFSNEKRQVFVSNESDFFEDFEKTHGAGLPAENATYGNEWDLYSASMAETSARVRRAVEKLRAAELMAALVGLKQPTFLRGRDPARDLAFTDLGLYWEHDWTADGPVSRESRAAWQELLASEIEYYVNSLHADAATQLGALIQKPDPQAQTFYALNPLGWPRTDYADFAYSGSKNIHVRDLSTGQDVPHQFVRLGGIGFLRVLA
ncbi:MAG TPA: glycoside hydrolase, partial [Bacillota bacterium]|nr:glycoside hydrolase [Bacillota bacterium]